MNTNVRMAMAAVAIIAVAGIALALTGRIGGVGGLLQTPSPSPSVDPTPTPEPPFASAAPLTETFTSSLHGISVSYPGAWTVVPATRPWTAGVLLFLDPSGDFLHDPALRDHLFVGLGSQAVGETAAADWLADTASVMGCASTEPLTIDGVAGQMCVDAAVALVVAGGRGYVIVLYTSSDNRWQTANYDRTWFEGLLATVQLFPEDAVDATPPPS